MTGADPFRVARQGIAYVPEGRGIFPNLTVRENLVMAARAGPDGRRDWTYERVLATFPRLAERLDHGGGQLSGGEQQMLTIGRALMTNPDLLILDEATEGLAPLIAREIWRIVGEIRAHGIATLIVDKNYRAVTAIADRNVILVKGRVVFEGDSRDAARAAGRAAPASRSLSGRCRSSTSRRIASSIERIGIARAEAARRSSSCTRDWARSRCGATSRRASRGRRGCAPSSIRASGTASPSRCAAPRTVRYMHDEALIVLPALLDRLAIDRPILIGHSDGGSIALIHAATRGAAARRRRHARGARARRGHLGREHRRREGRSSRRRTFARSSRAIMPTSIRRSGAGTASGSRRSSAPGTSRNTCRASRCPVLAIQGEDDEYGTMEQMRRIGAKVADVELARAPELPPFGAQGPARRRHRRHRALRRRASTRESPIRRPGRNARNADDERPAPFEARSRSASTTAIPRGSCSTRSTSC